MAFAVDFLIYRCNSYNGVSSTIASVVWLTLVPEIVKWIDWRREMLNLDLILKAEVDTSSQSLDRFSLRFSPKLYNCSVSLYCCLALNMYLYLSTQSSWLRQFVQQPSKGSIFQSSRAWFTVEFWKYWLQYLYIWYSTRSCIGIEHVYVSIKFCFYDTVPKRAWSAGVHCHTKPCFSLRATPSTL